ncbi:3-oxoadipate enol-lactonase [Paracandidimonas soli]|uniref:3-oxoadipate enol-lactonase n=1 Tax=Paracandidimonas soli TaxID=1917182 RepID=A0A4R3UV40_9BURK|nr:3-oxoadipate enol-lactonase [Paracandidimonas soli]TCU96006.1 3-oxoadipate enol-lactonase [Paracandidimonas soli]
MHTALVNGARIAYCLEGPAGAPVVMLSNSLMSTHRMWDPQMPALLERYQVLRYDTRGHGESETTPGPYTIELLADDAAALIDALDLGAVHFAGLSMGGMIGQQLAVRHPAKVLSLSLCDTASEMPPRSMWVERFAVAHRDGMAGTLDTTIKRWFVADFVKREPAIIEQVREMILATSLDGYIACGSAVRDMSQTHILPGIQTPTQIIVGREDPACTLAASQVLQANIPGAVLHVIDDAAHLSNLEKPAEFAALLRNFIDIHADAARHS